jgi:hypothetical protein
VIGAFLPMPDVAAIIASHLAAQRGCRAVVVGGSALGIHVPALSRGARLEMAVDAVPRKADLARVMAVLGYRPRAGAFTHTESRWEVLLREMDQWPLETVTIDTRYGPVTTVALLPALAEQLRRFAEDNDNRALMLAIAAARARAFDVDADALADAAAIATGDVLVVQRLVFALGEVRAAISR